MKDLSSELCAQNIRHLFQKDQGKYIGEALPMVKNENKSESLVSPLIEVDGLQRYYKESE